MTPFFSAILFASPILSMPWGYTTTLSSNVNGGTSQPSDETVTTTPYEPGAWGVPKSVELSAEYCSCFFDQFKL
jgi:hypothetical protein